MDIASELALPDSQLLFGRLTHESSTLGATIGTSASASELTLRSLLSPTTGEPMHITLSPASGRLQVDGSLCMRSATSTVFLVSPRVPFRFLHICDHDPLSHRARMLVLTSAMAACRSAWISSLRIRTEGSP